MPRVTGCRVRPLPGDRRQGASCGLARGLVSFLDLDQFVGEQPVGFAMHRDRRFLVRRFDETEHLARLLVEPVLEILHAVLLLRPQVDLVRSGDRVFGQARNVIVDVDEQRKRILSVSEPRGAACAAPWAES